MNNSHDLLALVLICKMNKTNSQNKATQYNNNRIKCFTYINRESGKASIADVFHHDFHTIRILNHACVL